MKIWLDDIRKPPTGWTHVKTLEEIKTAFASGNVTHMSLDHDLGLWGDVETPYGTSYKEINGRVVIDWMEAHNKWPSEWINIHSSNSDGAYYMATVIKKNGMIPNRLDEFEVRAKFNE